MSVNGFDHVNIRTRDLAGTVAFYADVFDLTPGPPPAGVDPARFTWMSDAGGRALFHLRAVDAAAPGGTGAIDHVALDVSDHAAMIERLTALAVPYRSKHVASIDVRQIFIDDPNGVRLELNFRSGQH